MAPRSKAARKTAPGMAVKRTEAAKQRSVAPRSASTVNTSVDLEALKGFIRANAESWLEDPNINSVGIGLKQASDPNDPEHGAIAIQFTVDSKVAPEAVEAIGSKLIPEHFVVNGVQVPTDVFARRFKPGYVQPRSISPDYRKRRIDPVVPGVSVSHIKGTAGTAGCVVYDATDGTPYVLSNWHVFHTATGHIGDVIVQPGPYDDNRVDLNRLGVLVRSHIGAAGDCAISTVANRALVPDIYQLGVKVNSVGVPELNEVVTKSGRTSAVTYGKVRRIDVISKMAYPGLEKPVLVGGFEIGVDLSHPPANGEISQGGDSGSSWMAVDAQGRTTTVMLGLHFAGESAASDDEHALACYAHAVFKKLEIEPSPPTKEAIEAALEKVATAKGYDPTFLSRYVPAPAYTGAVRDMVKVDGRVQVHHTHFSLTMHATRRLAIWVGWNIDGGKLRKLARKGLVFKLDPDIPEEAQVNDTLYSANKLDRGHVARRADLTWGTAAEAAAANRESFFFSNITPQHQRFNQGQVGGIWGRLEDAIYEVVQLEDLRVSVFAGAVFKRDDPSYRDTQIPREFWKLLAFGEDTTEGIKYRAKAFILTQDDLLSDIEALGLEEFRVYQVPITGLESRTRLDFHLLKDWDTFGQDFRGAPQAAGPPPRARLIESVDDVVSAS